MSKAQPDLIETPLPGQRRLKIKTDAKIVRLPSSELHRALSAIVHAACTEPDRPELNAVHIAAHDELVFTATDGHQMAQWKQDAEELPSEPCAALIQLVDIQRLIPLLAIDAKVMDQACIDFEDSVVTLKDGTILPLGRISMDPPPYDTIWPNTPPEAVTGIGFTASLMAKVIKAFTAAGGKNVVVCQVFRGELGGMVFGAAKVPELSVILMPARTSEEAPLGPGALIEVPTP